MNSPQAPVVHPTWPCAVTSAVLTQQYGAHHVGARPLVKFASTSPTVNIAAAYVDECVAHAPAVSCALPSPSALAVCMCECTRCTSTHVSQTALLAVNGSSTGYLECVAPAPDVLHLTPAPTGFVITASASRFWRITCDQCTFSCLYSVLKCLHALQLRTSTRKVNCIPDTLFPLQLELARQLRLHCVQC